MSTIQQWVFFGSAVVAAAVGIISLVSTLVQDKYKHEQSNERVDRDFARMNAEMTALKMELETIKSKRKKKTENKKVRRSNTNNSSALSNTSDDYISALDIDSSDLEFYDISDDEESSLANGNTTSSLHKIYKEIDSALDESNNISSIKDALCKLQDLSADYKEADLFWRLGRAYYIIASDIEDQTKKMANIEDGLKACDEALALDQNSSNSHKWYALLIGARTNFVSMTERIKDGHVFKEHLDKAIKLNPNESTLYHMLGRFLFEVAGLKWYERKTASMLFSEVPTGTYDEALTNFMNSEKLSKEESKENKLYIGKCHIEFGSYRDALKWLDEANNIIDTDEQVNLEVLTLIEKYNRYR